MMAMEAGPDILETLSHLMQHFKTLWYMLFVVCNDNIKICINSHQYDLLIIIDMTGKITISEMF